MTTPPTPCIALLTDFGTSDAYVGTMKGVMLGICPQTPLIDITHTIQPQNVRQAAYVLSTAYRYFPPATVFLVVVDPGVGTAREPIAVQTSHGVFVAPDNGVLSDVLAGVTVERAVVLQNPDYRLPGTSHTFHGRDIFSPAAAHLANGVPIEALGPALDAPIRLPDPVLAIAPPVAQGEVLHIDHFGNVITSIGRLDWLDARTLHLAPQVGPHAAATFTVDATRSTIAIGDHLLNTIRPTYGTVPAGALTALVGSAGQLEIGMNQGDAARALRAALGDHVELSGLLCADKGFSLDDPAKSPGMMDLCKNNS